MSSAAELDTKDGHPIVACHDHHQLCPWCAGPIVAGEQIDRTRIEKRWVHDRCENPSGPTAEPSTTPNV